MLSLAWMILQKQQRTSANLLKPNQMTATTPIPDLMGQAIRFRKIMQQPVGTFNPEIASLQRKLISEEYEEFLDGHAEAVVYLQNQRSREALLKECADLVFVVFQYCAAAGWPLDEALDRVFESNLSKLVDGKPVKNEDGKVIKGPNYRPPYLTDLV